MDAQVNAIAVVGDTVYFGGSSYGGSAVDHVARYDPAKGTYSSIATFNGYISSMLSYENNLYVGGGFTAVNGTTGFAGLAKFDGTQWLPVGSGASAILSLAQHDNALIAYGYFTQRGVYRWDGSQWAQLGSFPQDAGDVYGLYSMEGKLYATSNKPQILCFDGTQWQYLSDPGLWGSTRAITGDGKNLFVGGDPALEREQGAIEAGALALYNPSAQQWSGLDDGFSLGSFETVDAVLASGTNLYVTGQMTYLGGLKVNGIARYDIPGKSWYALGSGLETSTMPYQRAGGHTLAISGDYLYVGGNFQTAGGITVNNIARWNTKISSWESLGASGAGMAEPGVNQEVYAVVVNGSDIYAGGIFSVAGGIDANLIARWNAAEGWAAISAKSLAGTLGPHEDPTVYALTVSGNELLVGGKFSLLGDQLAGGFARYDLAASEWKPLHTGDRTEYSISGTVPVAPAAMTDVEFNDGLYILDGSLKNIIKVTNGQGELLESTGVTFSNPVSIVHSSYYNQFVVADQGLNALVGIDNITSERTIFSGAERGEGPAFARLVDVEYIEYASNRFFLALDEELNALLTIDGNGNRTMLSGNGTGSGPAFQQVAAVGSYYLYNLPFFRYSVGYVPLVVDRGAKAVFQIDPSTGDRSILSGPGVGSGPEFVDPRGIASSNMGYLIVVDAGLPALVHVDAITGNRTIISDVSTGSGTGFSGPLVIANTREYGDIYVADGSQLLRVTATEGPSCIEPGQCWVSVNAITASGSDAYLGGSFSSVEGKPAKNLAKLTLSTREWAAVDIPDLPIEGNLSVNGLAFQNEALYAVGGFGIRQVLPVGSPNPFGRGLSMPTYYGYSRMLNVKSMALVDQDLYAVGDFIYAGGVASSNIARWSPVPDQPSRSFLKQNAYIDSKKTKNQQDILNIITKKADPVNVLFGNFTYEHTDLFMPGIIPVSMERSYNSAIPEDGLLGWGWNLNWDMRLSQPNENTIVIRYGSGREELFHKDGDIWVAPAASGEILTQNLDNTFTLTTRDHTRYTFSAQGLMTRMADANGNYLSLNYNGSQWLGLTDASGRQWQVGYNAAGRIASITDPALRQVTYEYNDTGNLIAVTNPLGDKASYQYDSNHRMTRQNGNDGKLVTTNAYDAQGNVVHQVDGRGGQYSFAYLIGQTIYTAPNGAITTTYFNDAYQITHVNENGRDTYYTYDGAGNLIQRTNAAGKATTYTYDAAGRATSVTTPDGAVVQMEYDSHGNLIRRINAMGKAPTYTYNTAGQMLTSTNVLGKTAQFTYNEKGLLVKTTDTLGRETRYEYDQHGNQTAIINPLGQKISYTYDAAGMVTSTTDPMNRKTQFTYDGIGQLLTTRLPDGGVTIMTYSPTGNLLSVTDALDHTAYLTYDEMGNLVKMKDPTGQEITYTYDISSNRTSMILPDGKAWLYAYDLKNQLVETTSPLGLEKTYSYDSMGNLLTYCNERGNILSYEYDAVNRPVKVIDALNGTAQYTYNANGNITSVVDPNGNIYSYEYDALGHLLKQKDPLGQALTFTYDDAGQLTSRVNGAGQTVTYDYDAAGRLLSVSAPGINNAFTYNDAGQRSSMTDAFGTTMYDYDAAGRLVVVNSPQGTIHYSYNLAGNRIGMSQPEANLNLAYGYDEANRLIALSLNGNSLVTYQYDMSERLSSQTYGNGVSTQYHYDADSRLTEINTLMGNSPLLDIVYTLDAGGNRTSETTALQGKAAFTANYTYDALSRLVNATIETNTEDPVEPSGYKIYLPVTLRNGPTASLQNHVETAAVPQLATTTQVYTYTYDAAGNRLSASEAGNPSSFTYNSANQPAGYSYDAAGRLVDDGKNTYTYDALDRLTGIQGEVTASYGYDGNGVRVQETISGVSTTYLVDAAQKYPVRIAATSGGKTARYFFGLGLVAQQKDGALQYIHTDGLGSLRLVTDAAGKVSTWMNYAPFGQPLAGSSSFGFSGEPQAGGLVYLRSRDYSPALGRFLTPDPVGAQFGDTQSINPYQYAYNNPVNLVDPSGMTPEVIESIINGMKALVDTAGRFISWVGHGAQAAGQAIAEGVISMTQKFQLPAPKITQDGRKSDGRLSLAGIEQISNYILGIGGGTLNLDAVSNVIAMGGGNVIAFGGGNVIAFGGGNVIAMGGGNVRVEEVALIASAMSSLKGNFSPLTIASQVIAFGGGNLISDKGLGLISDKGLGLISDKGGGIISDKGLGLIGNDVGSLIGNDVGSLIGNDVGS